MTASEPSFYNQPFSASVHAMRESSGNVTFLDVWAREKGVFCRMPCFKSTPVVRPAVFAIGIGQSDGNLFFCWGRSAVLIGVCRGWIAWKVHFSFRFAQRTANTACKARARKFHFCNLIDVGAMCNLLGFRPQPTVKQLEKQASVRRARARNFGGTSRVLPKIQISCWPKLQKTAPEHRFSMSKLAFVVAGSRGNLTLR